MTEDAPPLYTGPIRVVRINESNWMQAGDRGTLCKTVAALGPVERNVELSVQENFYRSNEPASDLSALWHQNAAEAARPVTENNPNSTPVVFVSCGQIGLRPVFAALCEAVKGPTLWLDIRADVTKYVANSPAAPTMINAFVDKKSWGLNSGIESAGHKRILLPYLPELRGLPSRSEARANLAERYHLEFKRPLMAVLIGKSFWSEQHIVDAARALSADLLVTTSPRSRIGCREDKWQKNALIFHDFRDSPDPNPYVDFIAAADCFAVDADSLSMPADALAQGKPVALFGHTIIPHGTDLITRGFATMLTGADTEWRPPPPHETPGAILNRVVRAELAKLVGGGP